VSLKDENNIGQERCQVFRGLSLIYRSSIKYFTTEPVKMKLRNTNKEWLLCLEALPQWFGLTTKIGNQCLFSPSIIDDNDNNNYCPYRDNR
jgi:hypothetical protein